MRFPEFSGEWVETELQDIVPNICSGKDRISNSGEVALYGSTGVIGRTNSASYKENIVLVARVGANAGQMQIGNAPCGVTDNTLVIDAKEWNYYIYYFLQHYNLNRLVFGSGQPLITGGMLKRIKVRYGCKAERNNITRLLCLIDERIATQNKIIEKLESLIKGIYSSILRDAISDAMFCSPKQSAPRKRIKGFYTDWQKVHLNDICSRVTRKNTNGRCYSVLTIAAQYGLVSQLEFFNKSVASENLEGYYLLQKGDFAYNKSYSSEYTCGAVKRLDRYEEGVLSPLYICFRPDPSKVDSDYLAYYFESKKWHREIMDISVEGARNHGLLNISVIDYFNTIHRIPNIEEQRAIAKVIKTIIHKMSSEQTILDCYVKQRTFLLQQMFI